MIKGINHGTRLLLAMGLLLTCADPAAAIYSFADGSWTSPGIWDANRAPDQSLNGGNGEDVFIGSDVIVPAGVDYVSSNTIVNGQPTTPNGNNWMFFDVGSAQGSSLTIQSGARVGSKYWTLLPGGGPGSATINVEGGGEYVTAGIANDNHPLTINVATGGTLTFDGRIHPTFPVDGFYRANIAAGTGGSNTFNIQGTLDVLDVSDANAVSGTGVNNYNLSNGGVINEAPLPGQAVGDASGNPEPRGSVPYSRIFVTGSGTVANAFAGASLGNVQAGLTVDISDQTVFDSNSAAWTAYILSGGAPTLGTDPEAIPGPRVAELPFQAGAFSGSGTIQFDVYDIAVNDQGTPGDTGDDGISNVFYDSLTNGSTNFAENTFNGTFDIDYVGPEITDQEVALLTTDGPGNSRQLLLINGAGSNGFFDNLVGLPVPDQVWDDGSRQFLVEFSDTYNFGDPRFVFVNVDAMTEMTGQAGDFDGDDDVDGADILVWQRGDSPNFLSPTELSDWRTNFGDMAAPIAAVPEPCGAALLLTVAGIAALGVRRDAQR